MFRNWKLTLLVLIGLIVVSNSMAELTKEDIRLIVKEENSGWIHVILGFLGAGLLAAFVVIFHYTRHLSNIASDMKEMRQDILTRVRIDLDRIEGIKQFITQDIEKLDDLRAKTVADIETLEQLRAEIVGNIVEISQREEQMEENRKEFLAHFEALIERLENRSDDNEA